MSTCCYITKKGTECTRKAIAGETMCKQHIEVARVEKEKEEQRIREREAAQAYLIKKMEESKIKEQKRGTEEQRAKFRADVLAAWYAARKPEPILVEDEDACFGYDSELEVFEDGVGLCSVCGEHSYCVKVSHGQVYCVDKDCSDDRYTWYYDSALNYPQEIPEEYRM